jgi:hypothetical protein
METNTTHIVGLQAVKAIRLAFVFTGPLPELCLHPETRCSSHGDVPKVVQFVPTGNCRSASNGSEQHGSQGVESILHFVLNALREDLDIVLTALFHARKSRRNYIKQGETMEGHFCLDMPKRRRELFQGQRFKDDANGP